MKKIGLAMLVLLLLISAVGCGGTAGDVDLDLSSLSSTVAYAQALQMTETPQDYAGKTVRLSGQYMGTGSAHSILVFDGTCCTAAIGFTFAGSTPKPGTRITITGTVNEGSPCSITVTSLSY